MTTALDRPSWLALRRTGIGSSDAAAIVGMSPFKTALDVYYDKLGESDEDADSVPMEIGRALESGLAALYEARTGLRIVETQVLVRSEEHPFVMATLDGIREDGVPVEFKTAGSMRARELGEEGSDELPVHWLIQGTHQLIATGASAVDFAVLTGGASLGFGVFTVERDDRLIANLIEREAEFWDRVQRRDPPPMAEPSDVQYLSALYGDGEGQVSLGYDTAARWEEWIALGEREGEARKARDLLKLQILRDIGEASCGVLPDGSMLTRKRVEVAAHERKASSYFKLSHKKGRAS